MVRIVRHIVGAASKIEDENVALGGSLLLVKTISDGGSGGLVDDTETVETSDDTRVLGGLPLGVVAVGGDSDDGIHDLYTEISLSSLHLGDKDGVGGVNGDLKRVSSYWKDNVCNGFYCLPGSWRGLR